MQTINEYKEYTKQLEGEVKQWHNAYDALQIERNGLAKTLTQNKKTVKMITAQLEEFKAENERLKKCEIWMKQHFYCEEVIACESAKNRKLKRTLWIARAKRAIEKIAWFKLWNASISTMNPEDGARQEYDKWEKALGKCLKKAEEYK